ncbi:MAG: peptidase inhibitor family I36 protein, partial [Trebonia sp.]
MAIVACVALAASLFAATVGTAPASSGSISGAALLQTNGLASCDGWDLCLYRQTGYSSPFIYGGGFSGYGLAIFGDVQSSNLLTDENGYFGNSIESIVNNSGNRWCFYSGTNFTGETFEIHGGDQWSTLPGYINSKIESFEQGPCPTVIGQVTG